MAAALPAGRGVIGWAEIVGVSSWSSVGPDSDDRRRRHPQSACTPTDKSKVRKPAEFLKSQLRLRVAIFGATVAVAAVLTLMGVWWLPASFLALGLLFVLGREALNGGALDPAGLRKGILGEEAVANVLARLPTSYWVLHGVYTGHGDVDHVIIGPTGVFALETKGWEGKFYRSRGQLYCNGKPAEHVLQQVRGAAGQVHQILLEAGVDEWVEAVVAAARASVARSPLRFRNAYVVSIEDVVGFVTSRRRSLSSATILQAAGALLRPGEQLPPEEVPSPAPSHEDAAEAD